jgi:hypothetical protein
MQNILLSRTKKCWPFLSEMFIYEPICMGWIGPFDVRPQTLALWKILHITIRSSDEEASGLSEIRVLVNLQSWALHMLGNVQRIYTSKAHTVQRSVGIKVAIKFHNQKRIGRIVFSLQQSEVWQRNCQNGEIRVGMNWKYRDYVMHVPKICNSQF